MVTPIDVSSMKTVGLWKMPKPMNEEFLKASNIIATEAAQTVINAIKHASDGTHDNRDWFHGLTSIDAGIIEMNALDAVRKAMRDVLKLHMALGPHEGLTQEESSTRNRR